jgi:hypothetical protein
VGGHHQGSPRLAKRSERLGAALAQAPQTEHQPAAGRISIEHADVLANAAAKLPDDEQRAAFFDQQNVLADHAVAETPAQFSRTVRRVADRLAPDGGLERSERQRVAATLTHGMTARPAWVGSVPNFILTTTSESPAGSTPT